MFNNWWRKNSSTILVAVVSSILTAAVILSVNRLSNWSKPSTEQQPSYAQSNTGGTYTKLTVDSNAFVKAQRLVEPAVVYIDVQSNPIGTSVPDNGISPFFRQFLTPQPVEGTGSGFIFRSDGYILTNNHVVSGAQKLQVTLADNRKFSGRVVGVDDTLDLAVIKIEAKNLPVVTLGDSDALEQGQWVLAIGNPLGYHFTVTAGIISALNRSLNPDKEGYLIQTDAAINQGNSGGPLIDLSGNVVGINEAIRVDAQSMGFAIPINMVKKVLNDLTAGRNTKKNSSTKSWMGIAMTDLSKIDPEVLRQQNITATKGIIITQVIQGGPAYKAGLQELDVIMSVDRKTPKDSADLQKIVRSAKIGQTISVLVNRSGQFKVVKVRLESLPDQYAAE